MSEVSQCQKEGDEVFVVNFVDELRLVLSAAEAARWVPLKEREPEYDVDVQWWRKLGGSAVGGMREHDMADWVFVAAAYESYPISDFTHWRKISPPEGEPPCDRCKDGIPAPHGVPMPCPRCGREPDRLMVPVMNANGECVMGWPMMRDSGAV